MRRSSNRVAPAAPAARSESAVPRAGTTARALPNARAASIGRLQGARGTSNSALVLVAALLGWTVQGSRAAWAEVYLNETAVRGVERAEIHNAGSDSVSLTLWILRGDLGDFFIPDGTTIAPGQYLVFDDLGGILHDIGGSLELIDDLRLRQDRVDYGQLGGAPLPHDEGGVTLCRAPDASMEPPLDPANDALIWTLDPTGTWGGPNDAPDPELGTLLALNEMGPATSGVRVVNDAVELYNLTGAPVFTNGWYLTFGAGPTVPLSISFVPAGGVAVEKLPGEIDLDAMRLAYLFDDAGVRRDQLGWAPNPLAGGETCLARCPDGQGPHDGYDGSTSGVGVWLFFGACSLGELNAASENCGATPVWSRSWGRVKAAYH